jgi:hypothetical protein
LSRTPSSAGDRKTWTWSWWVKLGNATWDIAILHAWSTEANRAALYLQWSTKNLIFWVRNNSSWVHHRTTKAVYRDSSSWYHIVIMFDSTNSIAADRSKIYVNWIEQEVVNTTSSISQNIDGQINNTDIHNIWQNAIRPWQTNFDGYMADVHFIDWQAKTADDFGGFDAETGQWKAKEYSGSYGTNWFKLEFGDSSNVGKDTSGKGNDWDAGISDTAKSLVVTWNAKHSTTDSKIWNSSIYLDGSWDAITTPSYSDLSFWSWDFTIEFWTKQAVSQTSSHKYMLMWAQVTSFWIATLNYKLGLWVDDNWTSWNVFNWVTWTTPLNDNTWHHIAVVRNGTSYKGYVDWVAEISLTLPSANTVVFGDKIWIWAFANKGVVHPITGNMDEIRISNTARYTSNFTPQTTAFISDDNTKLLIHSDTTNWSTTFTDSSPLTNPNASDQMLDTPSNNFATLNPNTSYLNWLSQNNKVVTQNGNLEFSVAADGAMMDSTIPISSWKWYWETTIGSSPYNVIHWIRSINGLKNWSYT